MIIKPMTDTRIAEMKNLMKLNSPGMFSTPYLEN